MFFRLGSLALSANLFDCLLWPWLDLDWLVPPSPSPSHIATDGQSVSKSWCRAPSGAHDKIFITVWHFRSCFCGAPSLTRGRVCLLYMLLTLRPSSKLGFYNLGHCYAMDLLFIRPFEQFVPFHLLGNAFVAPRQRSTVIALSLWERSMYSL
jgi:hypothetical protein